MRSTGFARDFHELGEALGTAGVAVVLSVVAYVLGSLILALFAAIARWLRYPIWYRRAKTPDTIDPLDLVDHEYFFAANDLARLRRDDQVKSGLKTLARRLDQPREDAFVRSSMSHQGATSDTN